MRSKMHVDVLFYFNKLTRSLCGAIFGIINIHCSRYFLSLWLNILFFQEDIECLNEAEFKDEELFDHLNTPVDTNICMHYRFNIELSSLLL